MITRDDLKLILQFFFTFAITAGSILGGAMLETGTAQTPRQAVLLLALIVGFTTAATNAKAALDGKPAENLEQTVKQLVAQMRTVQVATAEALEPPPPATKVVTVVTPKRVDEETVAKILKDSS